MPTFLPPDPAAVPGVVAAATGGDGPLITERPRPPKALRVGAVIVGLQAFGALLVGLWLVSSGLDWLGAGGGHWIDAPGLGVTLAVVGVAVLGVCSMLAFGLVGALGGSDRRRITLLSAEATVALMALPGATPQHPSYAAIIMLVSSVPAVACLVAPPSRRYCVGSPG